MSARGRGGECGGCGCVLAGQRPTVTSKRPRARGHAITQSKASNPASSAAHAARHTPVAHSGRDCPSRARSGGSGRARMLLHAASRAPAHPREATGRQRRGSPARPRIEPRCEPWPHVPRSPSAHRATIVAANFEQCSTRAEPAQPPHARPRRRDVSLHGRSACPGVFAGRIGSGVGALPRLNRVTRQLDANGRGRARCTCIAAQIDRTRCARAHCCCVCHRCLRAACDECPGAPQPGLRTHLSVRPALARQCERHTTP